MTEFYQPGQSIEGDQLKGSSRNDLKRFGTHLFHGHRCTRYTAKFDVLVQVTKVVTGPPFQGEDADSTIAFGASINCEKAIIHTKAKKATDEGVSPRTHTHKAQFWSFNDHSHALVDLPHDALVLALEKRIQATVWTTRLTPELTND